MSYVDTYQWDVFVSYARADDLPLHPGEKGWVSAFVHALKVAVANYLGEDVKLFFDLSDAGAGAGDLEDIKKAAARSALMVAIVSPTYCRREWTLAELDTFREEAGDLRRLLVVERLPIGAEDRPPDAILQKNRAIFWCPVPNAEAKAAIRPSSERFNDLLLDFAYKLKERLRAIRAGVESPGPAPAIGAPTRAGSPAPAQPAQPAAAVRTVLIAQGTDDVAEHIESVGRYLGQFPDAVRVLPGTDYPQGGEDFARAFGDELAAADIFVQLLGARAGRAPPDLATSYTGFQLEAARRSGKKILQWRHPELDSDAIADEAYRAVVADPRVDVSGLEQFKARVLGEARRVEPEPARFDPAKVFINADRDNLLPAQGIGYEFSREHFQTALPKHDGSSKENRDYLNRMMAECGVLILVHGCPQPAWVATQKRLFEYVRLDRKAAPNALAICTVPPGEKLSPDLIGNEFEQIDCSAGFEAEVVRNFIAGLKHRGAAPVQAGP